MRKSTSHEPVCTRGSCPLWVPKRVAVLSAVTFALHVVPGLAQPNFAGEVSAQCNALQIADFHSIPDAPTQITEAKLIESKDDVPSYCQVQGYVAPQVGFEIRLPTSHWNGKFLKVGCGGTCGELSSQRVFCDMPLQKGYACLVSDMGHKGSHALWAYNNLQAEIDFAYRATHVATLAGKAIAARYYRAAPWRSYFMGCSTGGRQGLAEAQRFPWDFDGILVGGPGINETGYYLDMLWNAQALIGDDDKPLLGVPDVKLTHEATLSACDMDDGIKDGIIGNPSACGFDAASLVCRPGQNEACLTMAQVNAVKKIYSGPFTSDGRSIAPGGASPGSELNWIGPFVSSGGAVPYYTPQSVADLMRYLGFLPDPGTGFKPADFDFDRDYKRFGMMESLYGATNPDLRKFKAAGGKLIAYQGWADALALPLETIDYYDTVVKTMGGRASTEKFFRLFMLPGVNHCSGGVGADAVDFLDALEAWVEHGRAPDRLLSAHIKERPAGSGYPYRPFPADSAQAGFTRPVYPYPRRAIYRGRGDPNDAANFYATER